MPWGYTFYVMILPSAIGRYHSILGGLVQAELDGRIYLDRLPRGRVASHPGGALCLHQLAQAWNRELAQLPGLSRRGLDQQVDEAGHLFRRYLHLLRFRCRKIFTMRTLSCTRRDE